MDDCKLPFVLAELQKDGFFRSAQILIGLRTLKNPVATCKIAWILWSAVELASAICACVFACLDHPRDLSGPGAGLPAGSGRARCPAEPVTAAGRRAVPSLASARNRSGRMAAFGYCRVGSGPLYWPPRRHQAAQAILSTVRLRAIGPLAGLRRWSRPAQQRTRWPTRH